LDHTIAALGEHIDARTAPYAGIYQLLDPVPGLDQRSIDVIIAETGADMGRFPTAGDLASWAGLGPGNAESAGKRRKVAATPGNQWLRRALVESARGAARAKTSYFAAQYHHLARRRGPNKAAVAVAHSLIEVVWHLLTTGEQFHDLGADYYHHRIDPERQARRLMAQLERLGFTASLTPLVATQP
jgi:transposase